MKRASAGGLPAVKKDLTAIRNTPVHTPGPFRVVDKTVDTGRGSERPDPVADDELRRRDERAPEARRTHRRDSGHGHVAEAGFRHA